ncbi:MAG: type II toxin-antitoxin system VapC family toxin [Saprospirales bacterium]|nr:type II toxin-antitoxin system VapC family toxin [Saprospirales bacterium]
MNSYLLDTDICVYFLQGKFGLTEKIEAIGIDNCYVSEITIAELLFGAENSQNYEKHISEVEKFERSFSILPIYSALRTYAKEKVRLRKAGSPLAEFDLLIGTTAVHHDLILVSGNVKHFSKIQGIQLEDWTKNE